MERCNKKMATIVIATAVSVGVAAISTQAVAKSNCPVEKCYGIAKKAKNDCGTPKHACAAQSTKDGAKSEWIYVLKGSCESIVGGSLKAPAASVPAKK